MRTLDPDVSHWNTWQPEKVAHLFEQVDAP